MAGPRQAEGSMVECVSALVYIDEMIDLVKKTKEQAEGGFLVCRKDRSFVLGARCSDPGGHCTIRGPPCPEGGQPAISFHTHSTTPPLIELVASGNPFVGETAKVALLPSTRDIAADGEIGAEVGCIGGDLNDSTVLVWCFRGLANPPEREHLKVEIGRIQQRLSAVLKIESEVERSSGLIEILAEYFESVGTPCLELRLPA